MHMTNHSAVARARSMIEVIRRSLVPGLAERNKAMADGYIESIFDCGLIERTQYEELRAEAEIALTAWSVDTPHEKHL
ncbi:hypothetical protein [Pseudomonas sp. LS-2]|uniref:hypothetical protein n=1 Tax=Pseudomonas sp. LS-2 TaxID=2315859 RepID=UPI000E725023|nr:hypothetical protein [Pseudomonas sp. LS-2]RJX81276.1 hypothetical protein D3M70_09025 [Pseudomonas sp. LS-2]